MSDTEFFAAYGRFMAAWADVELEVYKVLLHYSGVTKAVGRAIFSGTRARQAMAFIEAIDENEKIDEVRIKDLKYVFEQVKIINTVRDRLAHHLSEMSYGVDPKRPDGRAYTNAYKANKYTKIQVWYVDTSALKEMTEDLYLSMNHLSQHYGNAQENGFRPWREDPADDAPTPWLYKSPQPEKMAGR